MWFREDPFWCASKSSLNAKREFLKICEFRDTCRSEWQMTVDVVIYKRKHYNQENDLYNIQRNPLLNKQKIPRSTEIKSCILSPWLNQVTRHKKQVSMDAFAAWPGSFRGIKASQIVSSSEGFQEATMFHLDFYSGNALACPSVSAKRNERYTGAETVPTAFHPIKWSRCPVRGFQASVDPSSVDNRPRNA